MVEQLKPQYSVAWIDKMSEISQQKWDALAQPLTTCVHSSRSFCKFFKNNFSYSSSAKCVELVIAYLDIMYYYFIKN